MKYDTRRQPGARLSFGGDGTAAGSHLYHIAIKMLNRAASAAAISRISTGWSAFNPLTRRVMVPVWKWYGLRPVVRMKG